MDSIFSVPSYVQWRPCNTRPMSSKNVVVHYHSERTRSVWSAFDDGKRGFHFKRRNHGSPLPPRCGASRSRTGLLANAVLKADIAFCLRSGAKRFLDHQSEDIVFQDEEKRPYIQCFFLNIRTGRNPPREYVSIEDLNHLYKICFISQLHFTVTQFEWLSPFVTNFY